MLVLYVFFSINKLNYLKQFQEHLLKPNKLVELVRNKYKTENFIVSKAHSWWQVAVAMVVEGWSYGLQQVVVVMVAAGWCSGCVAIGGGGRGGGR